MSTLSSKLSAPRVRFPSIPATRRLSGDINALEAAVRRLQGLREDLRPGIVIMGPGRDGRQELESLDVPERLDDLIQRYEIAIAALADRHTEADLAETAARMFASSGTDRAECRRYLRDLIPAYRNSVGTRRAA